MRSAGSKCLALCGLMTLVMLEGSSAQPMTVWEWKRQEVEDYFRGATEIQLNGWQRLNERVMTVVRQLVSYSKRWCFE